MCQARTGAGDDVLPKNWASENWGNRLACSPLTREGSHEEEQVFFGGADCDGFAASGCWAPVLEVTRKFGISEATYYVCRKRYGQMAIAEIRRLRQLEDENSRMNDWWPI